MDKPAVSAAITWARVNNILLWNRGIREHVSEVETVFGYWTYCWTSVIYRAKRHPPYLEYEVEVLFSL